MVTVLQIGLLVPMLLAGARHDRGAYVRFEGEFGCNDWTYVIDTHAHIHHASGDGLFPRAVTNPCQNI